MSGAIPPLPKYALKSTGTTLPLPNSYEVRQMIADLITLTLEGKLVSVLN
jgi:hypothetical protein